MQTGYDGDSLKAGHTRSVSATAAALQHENTALKGLLLASLTQSQAVLASLDPAQASSQEQPDQQVASWIRCTRLLAR